MEDLPVGSEIILKVVETEEVDCTGCFFAGDDIPCTGICCDFERSDGKNVIFKEVKE